MLALLLLALAAQEPAERAAGAEVLAYPEAVLVIQGRKLRFGLELHRGPPPRAFLINGSERIAVPRVEWNPEELVLGFDHYASEITARRQADGSWEGTWTKRTGADEIIRVPFRAGGPPSEWKRPRVDLGGAWAVYFHGESGKEANPAAAVFQQTPDRLTGTILTPTGDYRFLAGRVEGSRLWLSCFDGAHAFLFKARLLEGRFLEGQFWSRNSWHEAWTAERLPKGADPAGVLPDPFSMTALREGAAFDFRFPDLDGKPVSFASFRGKPLIVEIFGSWCPNCHDAAPVLAAFKQQYGPQGLQVVGLAYELSGDAARDAEQARRYAARHGCDWPILLAGTSGKAGASKTLPALTGIKSYPTTLFIDREGRVQEIYTGFAGPATGEQHERLLARWHEIVQGLLAEPAAAAPPK